MESNFQKVFEFNEAFSVPVSKKLWKDVFTKNPKLTKLRLDLILEEVSELKEAVENHDMTETIDALADILYVVYGMGVSFGIDLNKAFDIVHSSNMSKLCTTEEDAQKTVELYETSFANGSSPYDTPAYRKSKDGRYWVIYNKSTGKILKNY